MNLFESGQTFNFESFKSNPLNQKISIFCFANSPYSELGQTYKESHNISKYFPKSTLLQGEYSNKNSFSKSFSSSEIIHLTGHSSVSQYNSDNNAILFNSFKNENSKMLNHQIDSISGAVKLLFINTCDAGNSNFSSNIGLNSLVNSFSTRLAQHIIFPKSKISDLEARKFSISFYRKYCQSKNIHSAFNEVIEESIHRGSYSHLTYSIKLN